jgi:hypothetical protein
MQKNTLINNKMKPTFELHKLPEGFIVTSDEKTLSQNGDKYLGHPEYNKVFTWNMKGIHEGKSVWINKVIAQQDQIDFSGLSEEKQKKIGWFDVEKLAELETITNEFNSEKSFITGFQKAQELLSDRVFTLEDMKKAFNAGDNYRYYENGGFRSIPSDVLDEEQFIESLSQKSWKVELEMEFCPQALPKARYTPKLTNGKIKIIKLL